MNEDSYSELNLIARSAKTVKRRQVEARITLFNVKPAVGFTLPSAGVTPAPSEKKSQNGEDAILLSGSSSLCHSRAKAAVAKNPGSFLTSPVIFTGEAAGRTAAGR
jgi:hypothetical protein